MKDMVMSTAYSSTTGLPWPFSISAAMCTAAEELKCDTEYLV